MAGMQEDLQNINTTIHLGFHSVSIILEIFGETVKENGQVNNPRDYDKFSDAVDSF